MLCRSNTGRTLKKGYISPYQYWFGCWYLDEPELLDWDGYRTYFKQRGFHRLEEKEKTI